MDFEKKKKKIVWAMLTMVFYVRKLPIFVSNITHKKHLGLDCARVARPAEKLGEVECL